MMSLAPVKADPIVRHITVADVAEAVGKGMRDFQSAPLYGLLIGTLFAVGGIAIVSSIAALGMSYLGYPLAAGFALLGPFAAIGLYEVSRRREGGQTISLGDIWRTTISRSEIVWMAFVTLFIFIVWMYQVRLLMALFLGLSSSALNLNQFILQVLTTNEGILFLLVGNTIGAVLSLVLFSLTVVSFPLLLERDVDFVTAMITSIRAVTTNPAPMIGWAVIVVMLLVLAALPFFLGLIVILPVLGHTTWHLYRRIVEPVHPSAF